MGDLSLGQLQTLLISLIALIFVVLLGLIAYVILAGRKKAARRDRLEPGAYAPRPAASEHPICLTYKAGALEVEIGGVHYRALSEIQDADLKRQVVRAAMEMIRFTGVLDQPESAPVPIDRTYHWREDVRQGSQAELSQIKSADGSATRPIRRGEIEDQFLSLLSEMGQAPTPEKPSIMGALERSRRPKLPEDKPRTFVDDIEDIVQRRLHLIPALQGRDLHVRAAPDGTVCFNFEGHEYQDVTELPNMTARELIQDSIKEWEETT